MPFKTIGLCDELVQGILATGYTAPTEIQAEAIPLALAGKDMIGCAQTGTGKTAAFVLPILNRLTTTRRKTKKKMPRSLIITPTRELAMQIEKSVQGYGRFTRIKSIAVYGGTAIEKQIKYLRTGVDIVVATPGRLIDHIGRGTVNLSTVEVLVLDEADRMLDMGFVNDIRKIIAKIPRERQTLLFSATISKDVTKLIKDIQRSPKMIQIGRQHNPIDTITQHIYPVAREQKMDLLLYMMDRQQMYSVLIFSRTKRGADRICRKLKQSNIKAEAIHSDRSQRQRMRALEGFKRGDYQVMVATDVAARGINVEGISHVFNYDVPAFPEDYVHRIGRTGRAEATGDAITFVSYEEIPYVHRIERFIDKTFREEYYKGFKYKGRLTLDDGPKGKGGAVEKKLGAVPRKPIKAKRPGQGSGSQQRGAGFGKKKKASSYKGKAVTTKKSKRPAASKSKRTFKGKDKPHRGSKPAGTSFKRSKKKSAKKNRKR